MAGRASDFYFPVDEFRVAGAVTFAVGWLSLLSPPYVLCLPFSACWGIQLSFTPDFNKVQPIKMTQNRAAVHAGHTVMYTACDV